MAAGWRTEAITEAATSLAPEDGNTPRGPHGLSSGIIADSSPASGTAKAPVDAKRVEAEKTPSIDIRPACDEAGKEQQLEYKGGAAVGEDCATSPRHRALGVLGAGESAVVLTAPSTGPVSSASSQRCVEYDGMRVQGAGRYSSFEGDAVAPGASAAQEWDCLRESSESEEDSLGTTAATAESTVASSTTTAPTGQGGAAAALNAGDQNRVQAVTNGFAPPFAEISAPSFASVVPPPTGTCASTGAREPPLSQTGAALAASLGSTAVPGYPFWLVNSPGAYPHEHNGILETTASSPMGCDKCCATGAAAVPMSSDCSLMSFCLSSTSLAPGAAVEIVARPTDAAPPAHWSAPLRSPESCGPYSAQLAAHYTAEESPSGLPRLPPCCALGGAAAAVAYGSGGTAPPPSIVVMMSSTGSPTASHFAPIPSPQVETQHCNRRFETREEITHELERILTRQDDTPWSAVDPVILSMLRQLPRSTNTGALALRVETLSAHPSFAGTVTADQLLDAAQHSSKLEVNEVDRTVVAQLRPKRLTVILRDLEANVSAADVFQLLATCPALAPTAHHSTGFEDVELRFKTERGTVEPRPRDPLAEQPLGSAEGARTVAARLINSKDVPSEPETCNVIGAEMDSTAPSAAISPPPNVPIEFLSREDCNGFFPELNACVRINNNKSWFLMFNSESITEEIAWWLRSQVLKGAPVQARVKSESPLLLVDDRFASAAQFVYTAGSSLGSIHHRSTQMVSQVTAHPAARPGHPLAHHSGYVSRAAPQTAVTQFERFPFYDTRQNFARREGRGYSGAGRRGRAAETRQWNPRGSPGTTFSRTGEQSAYGTGSAMGRSGHERRGRRSNWVSSGRPRGGADDASDCGEGLQSRVSWSNKGGTVFRYGGAKPRSTTAPNRGWQPGAGVVERADGRSERCPARCQRCLGLVVLPGSCTPLVGNISLKNCSLPVENSAPLSVSGPATVRDGAVPSSAATHKRVLESLEGNSPLERATASQIASEVAAPNRTDCGAAAPLVVSVRSRDDVSCSPAVSSNVVAQETPQNQSLSGSVVCSGEQANSPIAPSGFNAAAPAPSSKSGSSEFEDDEDHEAGGSTRPSTSDSAAAVAADTCPSLRRAQNSKWTTSTVDPAAADLNPIPLEQPAVAVEHTTAAAPVDPITSPLVVEGSVRDSDSSTRILLQPAGITPHDHNYSEACSRSSPIGEGVLGEISGSLQEQVPYSLPTTSTTTTTDSQVCSSAPPCVDELQTPVAAALSRNCHSISGGAAPPAEMPDDAAIKICQCLKPQLAAMGGGSIPRYGEKQHARHQQHQRRLPNNSSLPGASVAGSPGVANRSRGYSRRRVAAPAPGTSSSVLDCTNLSGGTIANPCTAPLRRSSPGRGGANNSPHHQSVSQRCFALSHHCPPGFLSSVGSSDELPERKTGERSCQPCAFRGGASKRGGSTVGGNQLYRRRNNGKGSVFPVGREFPRGCTTSEGGPNPVSQVLVSAIEFPPLGEAVHTKPQTLGYGTGFRKHSLTQLRSICESIPAEELASPPVGIRGKKEPVLNAGVAVGIFESGGARNHDWLFFTREPDTALGGAGNCCAGGAVCGIGIDTTGSAASTVQSQSSQQLCRPSTGPNNTATHVASNSPPTKESMVH